MPETKPLAGYDQTIQDHYAAVAKSEGAKPTSTMADEIVRAKETAAILRVVQDHAMGRPLASDHDRSFHVVDLGCGNGYMLEELAKANVRAEEADPLRFTGVEYTPALRAIAQERLSQFANCRVVAGDVRTIDTNICPPADVLILQRVLINLLEPDDQTRALDNLVRLLKPGGVLLAIEAFESGLAQLNRARAELGIEPLPPAHHNLYLRDGFFDHSGLAPYTGGDARTLAENFLSTHYFVTRVLHEATLKATGAPFTRNSHFVKFLSAALPDGVGDYSPLKLVLRQKLG